MQFERGKPPETPNAPYRAARIKDERWGSAGPGFEPGRAGPRLSLTSSQDEGECVVSPARLRPRRHAVPLTMCLRLVEHLRWHGQISGARQGMANKHIYACKRIFKKTTKNICLKKTI
jgi:hypothetical protein